MFRHRAWGALLSLLVRLKPLSGGIGGFPFYTHSAYCSGHIETVVVGTLRLLQCVHEDYFSVYIQTSVVCTSLA